MPIHEYQCDACGHRFERIQKFSDPPIEICPNCGKPALTKLISSPAFHLKGTGWYATDYAKKDSGTGKPGETKEGDSGSAAKDSSSKTDSKTETSSSDASSSSVSSSSSSETSSTATKPPSKD